MKTSFRRLAAIVAGITAATVGVATTASAGVGNYVSPGSGTVTTTSGTITLTPPGGFGCSANAGDATNPTQASTYFAAASVATSSINFNWGATAPTTAPFSFFLKDATFGTGVNGIFPGGTVAPFPVAVPTLRLKDLAGNPAITAGQYKIGVACYNANTGAIDGTNFAESPIYINNVTATGFTWNYGTPASAATLGTVTNGSTTATVAFTVPTADPAVTTYTVSVNGATRALTASEITAGAISLTGLTNGTVYPVTLTVSNNVGPAAVSNSVNVAPNLAAISGISTLTVTGAAKTLNLNWVNPSSPAPSGYTIAWTPTAPLLTGAAGGTATLNTLATSYSITNLIGNQTYSVTLTPTFSVTNPVNPPSVTASGKALPDAILIQDITVVRPTGFLVLTQRCGVNGFIAAETNSGIGFPTPLGDITASTTPTAGPFTDNGSGAATSTVDPAVGNYPYPQNTPVPTGWTGSTAQDAAGGLTVEAPAYPSHCGIDLGVAKLVTTGANAGQYFAASGKINQVTVVDTRDTDPGWTVSGTASNFVQQNSGSGSFSGNYLGWVPQVSAQSAPVQGPSGTVYTMSAAAGGAATQVTNGLGTSKVLASAVHSGATGGLGIALLDARLRLVIPINAASDTYKATLTISAA